jgi:hypothetical protein
VICHSQDTFLEASTDVYIQQLLEQGEKDEKVTLTSPGVDHGRDLDRGLRPRTRA